MTCGTKRGVVGDVAGALANADAAGFAAAGPAADDGTAAVVRAELGVGLVDEASNPFAKVATKPAYLCVTFLSHVPTKAEVMPLHAQDWKPELFKIVGREIYIWHPNGQGRSPLAAALGKLPLRGAVTTRNWNTVLKLREMLDGC